MIYLDYNATAPYSPRVEEYIKNQMVNDWANPSSEHDAGYILSNKIKADRQEIADFLGVSTRTLFFTSGATESTNTVLSIENLKRNNVKTLVSSKLEHHATLHCLEHLEKNGFKVLYISNDSNGKLNLDELETILKEEENCLVTLLFVNNEIGTINDISTISKLSRQHGSLIHIDAVQALGKHKFDLYDLDVDYASLSGHKIGAMKGIGLLYAEEPKKIAPLIHGGGQESALRPGTYNFPAIHSFRLAVEDIDFTKNQEIERLRDEFEKLILESIPGSSVNASDHPRVGNTSNIFLGDGIESRAVLLQLSRKKIYVSTGSACTAGAVEPSHVIQALGFGKERAAASLRFSFGDETVSRGAVIDELKNIIQNLS